MNCEVMVSIMNQTSKKDVVQRLKLKKCVIINQVTKDICVQKDDTKLEQKFLSFKEKGLSKSRNRALKTCTGDICIIADDDVIYVDDYERIIQNAYKKYKDADIIAFVVIEEREIDRNKIYKEGKVGYLKSMKLSSTNITFKRKSLIDNSIYFDEKFGAGSLYPWGEENILLFDCLKKGLKIYYVPIKIADKRYTGETTWDSSNSVKHFNHQGIIFYRMTKKFYWILILQFVIRKTKIYKAEMTPFQVLFAMFDGVKEFKKENK